MKRLAGVLTLAGMLLSIPLLGHAQTRDRSFEITPFGGYTIWDDDVLVKTIPHFRNPRIVSNPRGSIYLRSAHAKLLRHDSACGRLSRKR